jgi:hypothetical protein
MTKSIFTLLLMVVFTAFTAMAQSTNSTTETAQTQLDNCPLKGTPDCPLVKNCPKKGQPDSPYKNAKASCSKGKKPSCCATAKK